MQSLSPVIDNVLKSILVISAVYFSSKCCIFCNNYEVRQHTMSLLSTSMDTRRAVSRGLNILF